MVTRRFTPKSTASDAPIRPFTTAEEAWFWFARCQITRRLGARFDTSLGASQRPCDPDDVYRVVLRLQRRGTIRRDHLDVLGRFGLLGRPPDPRQEEEQTPSRLWEEALDHLLTPLREKGIVA